MKWWSTEKTLVATGLALLVIGLSDVFTHSVALTMWGFLLVLAVDLVLSFLDVWLWNKEDAGDTVLLARALFLGAFIACCVYRLVAG